MRALVLSGGGAKGAYQAGAIKYLLGDCGRHYDIITGVSVGAINAAHLAQFSAGSELDAAASLEDFWKSIDTQKVYRKWYRGALWYLPTLWKPSVFDSRPLHDFLRRHLKPMAMRTSGKKLIVGAVSKSTGEYATWNENDPDIVEGVLASSAFPGFLTPVRTRDDVWADGGSRDSTPLHDAILAGATHIDVICCNPDFVLARPKTLGKTLENAEQALDAAFSEIERNDLKAADLYNRLVSASDAKAQQRGKRYVELRVLRPSSWLLKNSLDFDPTKVVMNFTRGYTDARLARW